MAAARKLWKRAVRAYYDADDHRNEAERAAVAVLAPVLQELEETKDALARLRESGRGVAGEPQKGIDR